MSASIRVALLGNGFARQVMLPCLRQVEGVELAAIASPNLERARATAREFGIPFAGADHAELLQRVRPDLVFIVTPPHRHAGMAIDALAAGCHVVCEKPMALDARETERMCAAARAHPRQLALIDHELRFLPARLELHRLCREGHLGSIRHAEYLLHSPGRRDPALPWSWWSDRECGGGALGAIGSHAVDSLRHLLGEVESVRGSLATLIPQRRDPASGTMRAVTADDYAAAWLRFASGARATLLVSTVEGEREHRLTLAGSEGCARLDEQQPLRTALGREPWKTAGAPEDLPPSTELGIPDTDWARAFLRFSRRIVEAVLEGRAQVDGAATFEDGHRVQRVLDAVRRSEERGSWVEV